MATFIFRNQIIYIPFFFILLFLTINLCQAASSDSNRRIAEENYLDSWLERIVATHLGDEFPKMRDDLIRRKKNDENILVRHWYAWITLENWELHYGNDEQTWCYVCVCVRVCAQTALKQTHFMCTCNLSTIPMGLSSSYQQKDNPPKGVLIIFLDFQFYLFLFLSLFLSIITCKVWLCMTTGRQASLACPVVTARFSYLLSWVRRLTTELSYTEIFGQYM